MCSLYRSTHLLSSKYNSTYNHYCPNNWQQNEYTLSEHVKMCPKCPGQVIHQSCTGCCWHPLPLLHNDITQLLDVRHMVLLHLPLEDAPHELNRLQVWRHTWPLHHLHLQQQGSCHLGGVFWVVVMLENSFWRGGGGHHLRLQNVTVHVGIHVSLNEPQLPSTSSSHAAAQFSWYSPPGHGHSCWTPSESNKFTLDSADHRQTWLLPAG